ncbi:DUF3606 domain-containing protein [Polluticoccus soli]|uniref:DUF3606 domain-containing protein n=1 Tax=Polluticoccus soli TaxID=3034150 RepID=UPI0023E0A54D|nr:DUF3606 domain-containing protein [Flavipsychrobacter sp. JY13-12]
MARNEHSGKRNWASDRARVAGGQEHEVRYLAETLHCSEDQVREAIAAVGNSRVKIQDYIKRHSRR